MFLIILDNCILYIVVYKFWGTLACVGLYLVCLVHLVVLANSHLMFYYLYELIIIVKYCMCNLCCLVVLWPWLDYVILVLVTS